MLDRDEQDVADDLEDFDADAGHPGTQAFRVDEVGEAAEDDEDQCIWRLLIWGKKGGLAIFSIGFWEMNA